MKIKYTTREFFLKAVFLFWRLFPKSAKIKIVNFARTFYHRYKPFLYQRPVFNKAPVFSLRTVSVINNGPLVSIIIPTFNNPFRLKDCLYSIERNTLYENYEIILVDNNSFDPESIRLISRSGCRVIKYSYKFNFSKINNFAAQHAKGSLLLFLNNDTVVTKGWLNSLVAECQDENIGIAGSLLLYHNNTIQHAGLRLDPRLLRFVHIFRNEPLSLCRDRLSEDVDAVTGACMMIKSELFKKLGGFDIEYWQESQDVDLCLKAKKEGYKIKCVLASVLYHDEGSTRGRVWKDAEIYDSARLKHKWFDDYLILNPKKRAEHEFKKILLIKLLSLGDVVLSTAVIEAVRKKFPSAYISFATCESNKDIIEGNPNLNRVYLVRDFDRDEFVTELEYYHAVTRELLCEERWDLVYPMQVLDLECGYWGTDYHLKDLYADLANVYLSNEKTFISGARIDDSVVGSILKDRKVSHKVILMHTTSGWALKDWDYKKYVELADKLKENMDCIIFQVGGALDKSIDSGFVEHLQGRLSLKEVAGLMKHSDLLICPDSGLMHMAGACGLALVALFGPTSPPTGGPIFSGNYICIQSDSSCGIACHMRNCNLSRDCAKDIPVDGVYEASKKMLDRKESIMECWHAGKVYEGLARDHFNNRSGTGGFRI